jgi:predicted AAA+ superfamily ATPase
LARRFIETLNSRVSYESLKKGTDILSANTVKTLIELQEDHFSLRVVPRYDPQRKRFMPAKLKKVFPLDPFIARTWACIGWNIRRKYAASCPAIALDECAFQAQSFRHVDQEELTYLYSDRTKSEVDFCLGDFAFELKARGRPTEKQRELLHTVRRSFSLDGRSIPIVACLLGESRGNWSRIPDLPPTSSR